jgi:hypothetical protein
VSYPLNGMPQRVALDDLLGPIPVNDGLISVF